MTGSTATEVDEYQPPQQHARQAAAGFYIETALMTGNFAPDWLYADKEAGGGGVGKWRGAGGAGGGEERRRGEDGGGGWEGAA